MKTEVKEENKTSNNTIHNKIRLDKAYNNYHKIIDKNLPYKFSYLDEWLLKKSKLLLNESVLMQNKLEQCTPIIEKYRVYKRGTIIKVDFGVNLGSEMSQVHFAIVLNNYDNPKNSVLTVIPLTSKENKFNLDLENLIISKMTENIGKENKDIMTLPPEIRIKKLYKLKTLIEYYEKNVKSTYACCSLISTISKNRILPPINEYDIIGKERCPDKVMDIIDEEIKKRFTKN